MILENVMDERDCLVIHPLDDVPEDVQRRCRDGDAAVGDCDGRRHA